MEWVIYKHTSPSGKIYIGQTTQTNLNVRWQYGNGYKSHNTKFYKAIKKYGWSNFSHEIIEQHIHTQEIANEREIFWISFYNSFKNGYNSTPGGNMVGDNVASKPVVQIKTTNPKTIYKEYKSAQEAGRITGICSRNIGACCLKQGQITAGGYYWCFSDDFDKFQPQEKRQGKTNLRKVYCFETDSVFDSIVEASKKLNISKDSIYACCKNKQITAGHCHFCYYEDKDQYDTIEELHRTTNKLHRTTNKPHIPVENPIYQIEKTSLKILHEYSNIAEASLYTKISHQQIGKCANGKYTSAGGFYWCKKANWSPDWSPRINKYPKKTVYCIETNQKFQSLNEASKNTGIGLSSISQCCNKKLNTAGGRHWCFYDDYIKDGCVISKNKNERKVISIETKEVFDTIKKAASKYNINGSNISSCIRNPALTAGGCHWALVENYDEKKLPPKQRTSVMKKVRNIDTQVVYDSITEAAKAYGILDGNISRVCRKKAKTAGGCHWEYVDNKKD